MELNLQGKTAWITGASKGIGRACAERLAQEGCDLVLVSRTQADLERTADELARRHGVQARVFAGDLSKSAIVDRLWAGEATPDLLVNNAGAIPSGALADVDEAAWREAWELKVFGYINMCRIAMERMASRGSGVIINVIGAGGEKPRPDYAAGAGGNAALMALTRALGSTSSLKGVRVVGVNPGLIETERLETQMKRRMEKRGGDPARWRDLLDPKYPPGQPDHVAAMVAFLASDVSGNTTGTIVTVDGGASAR